MREIIYIRLNNCDENMADFALPNFDWNNRRNFNLQKFLSGALSWFVHAADNTAGNWLTIAPKIDSVPAGLIVHQFTDECFLQLSGECEFRFSSSDTFLLTPGKALLVPHGIPHAELTLQKRGMSSVNLVLKVQERQSSFHIGANPPGKRIPQIFREQSLPNAAFYRAALNAVTLAPGLLRAERLTLEIFAQLAADLINGTEVIIPIIARKARQLADSWDGAGGHSVHEAAALLGYSPNYLSKKFSDAFGLTLKQYLIELQLERARRLLQEGSRNVSETAFECGFSDAAYLARLFKSRFGCTPSDLLKH